jgi:hypothetical protein
MYLVSKARRRKGDLAPADLVPLSHIRQSCQLIPCFGEGTVPEEWKSESVLEQCDRFWLNNWSTKYAYQTLY